MTTPISESHPPTQPKAESFLDWFHINQRWITIGAIVVGLAVFGLWFVQRTSLNETISSERQLATAKQSLMSGNAPLAETDLKKVVDKYAGKPAGAEAGLLLAQLRMDKGDYAAAAGGLRDLAAKVTSGPNAAQIRSLLGDALAQSGKPAEAAVEYERASTVTTHPNEKNWLLAKAARSYNSARKTAEARKLYEALAAQSESEAVSSEAKVRLGEMTVDTAK